MEDIMKSVQWDFLIRSLLLIRLGQELGTESPLARAIHDVFRALVVMWQ